MVLFRSGSLGLGDPGRPISACWAGSGEERPHGAAESCVPAGGQGSPESGGRAFSSPPCFHSCLAPCPNLWLWGGAAPLLPASPRCLSGRPITHPRVTGLLCLPSAPLGTGGQDQVCLCRCEVSRTHTGPGVRTGGWSLA